MDGLLQIALFLLVACLHLSSAQVRPSKYCPTQYTTRGLRYTTIAYRCGSSGWWWWRRRRTCYARKCQYYVITRTNRHVCCPGWKGCRCNVPICPDRCTNGGLCLSPGQCSCPDGFVGRVCQTKTCSALTDCYPGTCSRKPTGIPTCSCTGGFDGSNCQNILDGPQFDRCSARLIDLKQGDFTGKCGPPGQPEDYTYYTNKRDPTQLKIDLETQFIYPGDVPFKPSYLPSFVVGNVESYAQVKLRYHPGGSVVPGSEEQFVCDTRPSTDTPHASAECKNKTYTWPHAIGHDYQMEINMYGVSGGYKVVNNPTTGRQDKKLYVGTPANQTVLINFDILKPHHCHQKPDENCTADVPPILNEEFTTSPNISLDFFGWDDEGTGLNLFVWRVHKMGPNSVDKMEISGDPISNGTQDVLLLTPENAVIPVILPAPGRYSVVVSVSDRAGNVQNARTLVTYDHANTLTQRPNTSVTIVGAVAGPYYHWLTSYAAVGATTMNVTWDGAFTNPVHLSNYFLSGVELLAKENPEWGYEDSFGNLTTDPIPHRDGVTKFKFAYDVDQIGGKSVLPHPPELKEVALATSHEISHTVADGYTVVLLLDASDCLGQNLTVATPVHVDSSPPLIHGTAEFIKDFMSNSSTDLPYTSRVNIPASDKHSGIGEVEYVITVASGSRANQEVGSGVSGNFRIDDVDDAYCAQTGNDCTCADIGDCFPNPVPVDVNNCWFRDYLSEPLRMTFIVKNGALLPTNGTPVEFGPLVSVFGLTEYPSTKYFQAINISHNFVHLSWTYPSSCHTPKGVIIERGDDKYHVSYPKTTFIVTSLSPESEYTLVIIINYGDQQSSGRQLQVTTTVTAPCPPGKKCIEGLSPGAIAGIIIGVLILLLLILLAIFLLVRWRTHKPLIPQRVRTMRHTFSNLRHTLMNKNNIPAGGVVANNYKLENETSHDNPGLRGPLNVAYMGLAGTEDDIYTYGELETDPDASWKHSEDRLTVGEIISSGRFAEVRMATLVDKNGRQAVTAKMLKAGANSDDQLLMKAKMNFLATSVPMHENVVMLVGAVPTDNPIILLEFCNMTLKDWLKDLSPTDVTEEAEDNMINFTTHIANGMEHLHQNHIVHRRLGVRNVMLKEVNGRYIAKLIGFGPMKNEVQGAGDDSSKERIPFKWMAPEQIGGKPGQRRVYNEKTDVWTYGITLWEIFSLGQSPYKDYKHGDMQEVHESGTRLPKPKHCPDELYNDIMMPAWSQDPDDRPTFSGVCKDINSLFGNDHDGYYYEAHDEAHDEKDHSEPDAGGMESQNYGHNLYA